MSACGGLFLSAVAAKGPAASVTSAVSGAPPAGAPAQATFRVHPVAGSISYIEGAGGNIGVLRGDEGLLLVDDQLARARAEVLAAVESVSEAPVRFLLNTHWHGDHTGNNAAFGEATILAHENVRRRLAGDPAVVGRVAEDTPEVALPDVTFDEALRLYWAGERIRFVHFTDGSHTDGDGVVFFETSKVVHMGDLFFAGRFPYLDLNSGGDAQGLVEALEQVLAYLDAHWAPLDDVKVIPGHGALSTVEDLRAYHGMLVEVTGRVKEALAQGQSAADMQAGGLVDDYDSVWGGGFVKADAFLETLATSLAR